MSLNKSEIVRFDYFTEEEYLIYFFCNGFAASHLCTVKFDRDINKVCRLDYVQLEDDIGYIKSSHTDLSSSN